MSKILLVEDDHELVKTIKKWLESEHHTVESTSSGEDALERLLISTFDIVILDINIEDLDGISVLRSYRDRGGQAPVIMLTGHARIQDRELGLDSGADDYLTKPFSVRELSARIRAVLRRSSTITKEILEVGGLKMNTLTRELTLDDAPLELYPKDFSLLEFFMRNPGVVFTSDTLIERVWSSTTESGSDAIRSSLRRIRQKVDKEGRVSLIETIPRVGYKLRPS